MALVFTFIEYQLFGLNAYAYFATTIALQATITTLFFYYLSTIGSTILAFFCALLFAFHPTLEWGLGKVDLQQHYIALLFIILSLIFLKKTMLSGHIKYRLLTLCCFFIAITTREVWLVFPAIAWGALSIFPSLFIEKQISWAERRNIMLQFCGVISFYLLLKAFAYPPLLSGTFSSLPITTTSLLASLRHSYTSLYELFLLYWYPCSTFYFFANNNLLWLFRIIKFLLVTGTGYLFIKSNQKQAFLYLILCIALLFWPVFVMPHFSHRYMYETLLFFCLALFLLCERRYSPGISNITTIAICSMLAGLIVINGLYVVSVMKKDATTRMFTDNVLTALRSSIKQLPKPQGAIFIPGYASNLVDIGFIQAVKLNNITGASSLCFLRDISIHQKNATLHQLLIINHHGDQLQLQSRNSNKLWFSLTQNILTSPFIQKIIPCQKDLDGHIIDINIIFTKGLLPNNIAIFAWDNLQQKFILIERQ
jgi:hypothetical protein